MGPDWYDQHGWHHVGMGGTLELLAMYGAILLIAALAVGGLWLARRRRAQPGASLHRWPTASLASRSGVGHRTCHTQPNCSNHLITRAEMST